MPGRNASCCALVSCVLSLGCSDTVGLTAAPERPVDEPYQPGPWVPRVEPPAPEDLPIPNECFTGALRGSLCAEDASALGGAYVYLYARDCNGEVGLYSTQAYDNGEFALAGVPEGHHIVYVDHLALYTQFEVDVVVQEITQVEAAITAAACPAPPEARAAVITGDYDRVENLLDDIALGYDLYDHDNGDAHAFLEDAAAMRAYDVIFINCTLSTHSYFHATREDSSVDLADWTLSFDYTAGTYENLRQFVLAGGNLYVSDLAWPMVEALGDGWLDFYGDERNGFEVIVGDDLALPGHIPDAALSNFMGADSLDVRLDADAWAVVTGAHADVDVYVRGNIFVTPFQARANNPLLGSQGFNLIQLTDQPLVMGFNPYPKGGRVIFTTFHYQYQPTDEMLALLSYLIFQL